MPDFRRPGTTGEQLRDSREDLRETTASGTTYDHSFRAGVAHFAGAAERLSKRITVLLALVSATGVLGSTGLTYWVTHQHFVQEDEAARDRDDVRKLVAAVESLARGAQDQRDHDRLQDDTLFEHTQQLAQLTPPGIHPKHR